MDLHSNVTNANAEEAEDALSAEETQVLEMAARAGPHSPVEQVNFPEQVSKYVESSRCHYQGK
jgi:hypothetical protein